MFPSVCCVQNPSYTTAKPCSSLLLCLWAVRGVSRNDNFEPVGSLELPRFLRGSMELGRVQVLLPRDLPTPGSGQIQMSAFMASGQSIARLACQQPQMPEKDHASVCWNPCCPGYNEPKSCDVVDLLSTEADVIMAPLCKTLSDGRTSAQSEMYGI